MKAKKIFPYKVVLIRWRDTVSDSVWTHDDEIKSKQSEDCITIGFLVEETDKEFKLKHTSGQNGIAMGYTIIPRSMVVKVKSSSSIDSI